MEDKTKQEAIFRALPGGKSDAAVQAYVDAAERVREARLAVQAKYGKDTGGYVMTDGEHMWLVADAKPQPAVHWKNDKHGYFPSQRASPELREEWRQTRMPEAQRLITDAMDVPAVALKEFIFHRDGRSFLVFYPIRASAYGDAKFIHLAWLGEPGDDPPWCPPDSERVSEIEYGKAIKAYKEAS